MLTSELRQSKDCGEVEGNERFPIGERIVGGRGATDHAGIVDENVDGAELVDGAGNQFFTDFRIRDIAGEIERFAAKRANLVTTFFARLRFSVKSDVRTDLSKGQRDCRSEAAA